MPLYFSLPHFLNCDSKVTDSIKGLNPNEKEHDFKLNVDPVRNTNKIL